MSDEFMTQAEFARKVGLSAARISQLVKDGVLQAKKHGRNNLISVADGLSALAASGDVSKQYLAAQHAASRARKGGSSVPPAEVARAMQQAGQLPATDGTSPAGSAKTLLVSDPMAAFNMARADLEIKKGEMLDIELAEKRGQLVSLERVVRQQADLAAFAVAEYERLPDRLATQLAAESEPSVIYALIEAELDRIRSSINQQAAAILRRLDASEG